MGRAIKRSALCPKKSLYTPKLCSCTKLIADNYAAPCTLARRIENVDAWLAAITSNMGKMPTVARHHAAIGIVNADGSAIYKYLNLNLNLNQIEQCVKNAKGVAA